MKNLRLSFASVLGAHHFSLHLHILLVLPFHLITLVSHMENEGSEDESFSQGQFVGFFA